MSKETVSSRASRHQQRGNSKRKNNRKKQQKSSPLKRTLKVLLVVVLLFALGSLAYGAKLFYEIKHVANNAYTPRTQDTTLNGKSLAHLNDGIDPTKDPYSVLVLGIDDDEERALGSARTDTMILVTVNPKEDLISMVSIPRDTYTYIDTPEFQGKDKINAAYTYGGDEGAIQAVQDLLNIPINYFLTVDFIAFEHVIDALGGIDIDVPFDVHSEYASENYNDGEVIIKQGPQTLNGEQALVFARMRKVDTDIERGKRGQYVIEQTIKKATEVGSVTKYLNVIKAVDGHFWTDMSTDTMMAIVQSSLTKDYTFENYTFSWMSFDYFIHGTTLNMVGIHQDSLDFVSHRLRVSLGLEAPDERDQPDYQFETNGIVSATTYPDEWVEDGVIVEQSEVQVIPYPTEETAPYEHNNLDDDQEIYENYGT